MSSQKDLTLSNKYVFIHLSIVGIKSRMAQIARNMCDMWDGKMLRQKYLIHDRDPLFCKRFKDIVHSIGSKTKAIPPRSPECNGYMESFIKTFKTGSVKDFC